MSELKKKFSDIESRLQELEELAISKIERNDVTPDILNFEKADKSELKAKIIEQQKIIENLSNELNGIQKTIKEVGKENDFLKDKNRLFADKMFKFKSQGSKLIQSVEEEVEMVRDIIKNKLQ